MYHHSKGHKTPRSFLGPNQPNSSFRKQVAANLRLTRYDHCLLEIFPSAVLKRGSNQYREYFLTRLNVKETNGWINSER